MKTIHSSQLEAITGGFTRLDRAMYLAGKFHGIEAGLSKAATQRNGWKWLQFGRANGAGVLPSVPLL